MEARVAGHRALHFAAPRPGPRLVLLHGFTGSAESWAEVAALLPVARDFEARPGWGTIAAVTLPGHDPETPVRRAGGFEGTVDDLAAVLRALGPGPAHVAGYSLGARLALGLGVRHPDLVGALVLAGVNPGVEREADRGERRELDARWATLLRREGLEAFLRAWAAQPLFATQDGLPPERVAAQAAIRRRHRPEALADCLEVLGLAEMPSRWPALPSLVPPVRLVVGARDDKFAAIAARMRAVRADFELLAVEGAGHNVVLEAPEGLASLLHP